MAAHQIDDTGDGYSDCAITCTCGQYFQGYSWQNAGEQFDDHLDHVAEMENKYRATNQQKER